MKTLNVIWNCLVPFIVSSIVWYLVTAFMCVSFDPADWLRHDREFLTFMSVVWGWALYYKLQVPNYE
jgi:hypothetical protein